MKKNKLLSVDPSCFIDVKEFADVVRMSERMIYYRVQLGHVYPKPMLYGNKYIFNPRSRVIIPEPNRAGGRPKGSTVANGAKKRTPKK